MARSRFQACAISQGLLMDIAFVIRTPLFSHCQKLIGDRDNESRTLIGPCEAGVKFIVFLLKDETKA
jgi:hypothetical protein